MRNPAFIRAILFVLLLVIFTPATFGVEKNELTLRDSQGNLLVDPIQLVTSVKISADGSIEVITDDTLVCDSPSQSCDDVTVGALTFDAVLQQVEVGEVLEFSWYSRGAFTCEAGGDLPLWAGRELPPDSRRATDAQRRVSTEALNGDFPLTFSAELLCHNGPVRSDDGVPKALAIAVEAAPDPEAGLPEECSTVSRRAPSSWRRLTTGSLSCRWNGSGGFDSSADCRFWDEVWPVPFTPGQYSLSRYLASRSSDGQDYVAVRFNSGEFSETYRGGVFQFDGAPNITNTDRLVSVSRCPGDFNQAAITSELGSGCIKRFTGATGSLGWGGPQSSGPTCILQPNTDYFLNLVFTEAPLGDVTWGSIEAHPDCQGIGTSNRCGTALIAK